MSFDLRPATLVVSSPFSRGHSLKKRLGIAFFAFALSSVTSQAVFAHDYRAGDLEIVHPWSRATPEGARVAAGYARIVNHGAEADRLIAATGEIAGRTEIHEMTVNAEGVMTMRPVDGLEIPAGGELALEPGGYHVMFFDLAATRAAGETFAGSLTFEKAGEVEVEFAVEAMGGGAMHGGHGNGSGHEAPGPDHGGHGHGG
jgi:periplasmic copper chaperone A